LESLATSLKCYFPVAVSNRYLNPLYYGDYPEVMHEILGEQLPKFTEEDKELLRNPMDFVGLNHYTSRFITHATESPEESYYYKAQSMERRGKSLLPAAYFQLFHA